jgi:hypothetical protein
MRFWKEVHAIFVWLYVTLLLGCFVIFCAVTIYAVDNSLISHPINGLLQVVLFVVFIHAFGMAYKGGMAAYRGKLAEIDKEYEEMEKKQ